MRPGGDVGQPDADDGSARRRAERIRLLFGHIADEWDKALTLLAEAAERRDWRSLGYPSWDEYLAGEFGEALHRLRPDHRREVVGVLVGEGMSTRAIAPIVGVSNKTVHKDMKVLPEVTPRDGSNVVGIDGKRYPRKPRGAEPAEPTRRAPTHRREGSTSWSRKVEAVSFHCPMSEFTTEEILELHGAATFLRDYCNGELILRKRASS
jgi:hypothetical protein